MNEIKVSVIIPVYNMEKYVRECMGSVLRQSLREIELICIDDGSTDSSLKILNEYAGRYQNVKVLSQSNKGSGAARNAGMEAAEGCYIAFMDPDDLYPSDQVLAMLYQKAQEKQAVICGGSACLYRKKGGVEQKRVLSDKAFIREGWILYRDYQYPYGYWRFIYHREFLKKHNIGFPLYKRYQDPIFMVKSFMTAEKAYVVPNLTYCYRKELFDIDFKKESDLDGLLGREAVLNLAVDYNLPQLWNLVYDSFVKKRKALMYRWYRKDPQKTLAAIERMRIQGVKAGFIEDEPDSKELDIEVIERESSAYAQKFMKEISAYDKVVIYGAGEVGEEVIVFLRKFVKTEIRVAAVTDLHDNLNELDGIPVVSISSFDEAVKNMPVIISVEERKRRLIRKELEVRGFKVILEADYKKLEIFALYMGLRDK